MNLEINTNLEIYVIVLFFKKEVVLVAGVTWCRLFTGEVLGWRVEGGVSMKESLFEQQYQGPCRASDTGVGPPSLECAVAFGCSWCGLCSREHLMDSLDAFAHLVRIDSMWRVAFFTFFRIRAFASFRELCVGCGRTTAICDITYLRSVQWTMYSYVTIMLTTGIKDGSLITLP